MLLNESRSRSLKIPPLLTPCVHTRPELAIEGVTMPDSEKPQEWLNCIGVFRTHELESGLSRLSII